ncbi:MAG: hypothetical protein PHF74_05685 [Dehalococcoidales bacterium]|nr:hypothetical protein [Dehalococcoidales bacterium]
MKKGDRFKCDYTNGGGKRIDEGEWIVKVKTDKTFVMEKISDGDFEAYETGETLKVGSKHGNPARFWDDGTFTVYPDQAGAPFYFEPIKEEIINAEPDPLF